MSTVQPRGPMPLREMIEWVVYQGEENPNIKAALEKKEDRYSKESVHRSLANRIAHKQGPGSPNLAVLKTALEVLFHIRPAPKPERKRKAERLEPIVIEPKLTDKENEMLRLIQAQTVYPLDQMPPDFQVETYNILYDLIEGNPRFFPAGDLELLDRVWVMCISSTLPPRRQKLHSSEDGPVRGPEEADRAPSPTGWTSLMPIPMTDAEMRQAIRTRFSDDSQVSGNPMGAPPGVRDVIYEELKAKFRGRGFCEQDSVTFERVWARMLAATTTTI